LIIIDRPPNFEQIKAAFPKAENVGILFAFDGAIYNPSGIVVPPALVAHENVHLERQRKAFSADAWWAAYLTDTGYRYNEELLAHAAEFKVQRCSDRNFVARLMVSTALRLVAPLYNYTPPVSLQQAMKDLRREISK
jgi:hypothetical protein